MVYVPLAAHPLGWVLLGTGAYLLYKAGKKNGQKQAASEKEVVMISDNTDSKGEK